MFKIYKIIIVLSSLLLVFLFVKKNRLDDFTHSSNSTIISKKESVDVFDLRYKNYNGAFLKIHVYDTNQKYLKDSTVMLQAVDNSTCVQVSLKKNQGIIVLPFVRSSTIEKNRLSRNVHEKKSYIAIARASRFKGAPSEETIVEMPAIVPGKLEYELDVVIKERANPQDSVIDVTGDIGLKSDGEKYAVYYYVNGSVVWRNVNAQGKFSIPVENLHGELMIAEGAERTALYHASNIENPNLGAIRTESNEGLRIYKIEFEALDKDRILDVFASEHDRLPVSWARVAKGKRKAELNLKPGKYWCRFSVENGMRDYTKRPTEEITFSSSDTNIIYPK